MPYGFSYADEPAFVRPARQPQPPPPRRQPQPEYVPPPREPREQRAVRVDLPAPDLLGIELIEGIEFPSPDALGIEVR
jgi:hypothetical protein